MSLPTSFTKFKAFQRKLVKKGFDFTLMVAGESGLGKSTLINSLFLTGLSPDRVPTAEEEVKRTVKLDPNTVEIEERGVKLRLTVIDTPGVSSGIFQQIMKYIDQQLDRYMTDESGLKRKNMVDYRVHCCFYLISPHGTGLKPSDMDFMRQLSKKVNIVPVIAKSDMLDTAAIKKLKARILEEIGAAGIRIYQLPDVDIDEDEDYKAQVAELRESVPFAVCGVNAMVEVGGKKVRGLQFPWGVCELENPKHNDFVKLKSMLISHMQDLQEVTHDVHYENFRSDRLAEGGGERAASAPAVSSGGSGPAPGRADQKDKALVAEKDEKLRRMQEMFNNLSSPGGSSSNPPRFPVSPSFSPKSDATPPKRQRLGLRMKRANTNNSQDLVWCLVANKKSAQSEAENNVPAAFIRDELKQEEKKELLPKLSPAQSQSKTGPTTSILAAPVAGLGAGKQKVVSVVGIQNLGNNTVSNQDGQLTLRGLNKEDATGIAKKLASGEAKLGVVNGKLVVVMLGQKDKSQTSMEKNKESGSCTIRTRKRSQ